jgi:hypothetical protein
MKKCLFCGKEILPKKNAHNVKFCSPTCCSRNRYYSKNMKEAQRKTRLEKLSQLYSGDELIKCQICGKSFRQVGSHIWQMHGCTAREYREEFGFDVSKGQLPKDLKNIKAEQAIECGGAENLKQGEKYRFKKGQEWLGTYKRSKQTMERLKNNYFFKKNETTA